MDVGSVIKLDMLSDRILLCWLDPDSHLPKKRRPPKEEEPDRGDAKQRQARRGEGEDGFGRLCHALHGAQRVGEKLGEAPTKSTKGGGHDPCSFLPYSLYCTRDVDDDDDDDDDADR